MPLTPRSVLSGKDITNQAIADFRYVFNLFDLNGDGTIDPSEFAQIIQLLGDDRPSDQELRTLIADACQVQPGQEIPTSLTFKHFLNFFAVYKTCHEPVDEDDIFAVLDRDGNGIISSRELARTLHGFGFELSREEADAMADVVSARHDTTEFTKDEFRAFTTRLEEFRRKDHHYGRQAKSIDESD